MTAARPWASAACLAGRPDDCPRVKDDGRRCANPAHDAYPDDLQPLGEQPTLEGPAEAVHHTPDCSRERIHNDPTGAGGRVCACESVRRQLKAPARRRRWTCDRCGDLVIRAEHVTGPRKDPVYACEGGPMPEPAPDLPPDPHEWPADLADRLEDDGDPHDVLAEAVDIAEWPDAPTIADVVGRGPVRPYGNNPDSVELAEQVTAAVRAKTRPVELTAGEVKRITAAHMVLRPEQALDVARTIITERLTNPEGVDQ